MAIVIEHATWGANAARAGVEILNAYFTAGEDAAPPSPAKINCFRKERHRPMSEPFVFDPRCAACKDPFGAVPCGTAVAFHCRPLASEGFTHCALVLDLEFAGETRELELTPEGPAGERACFAGVLTAPAEPDLIWYRFRLWREDGTGCVLDKSGYRSDGGLDPWQLTVYRENQTPAMVRGERDIPDISRSLPPPADPGPEGPHRPAVGPPGLGRHAGVAAGPGRGDPQPGLLRRVPGGRHLQAGLSEGPGRHHAVLLPHLRVRLQPPLQHGGLHEDRPHAGHGGGLPAASATRPTAGGCG